MTALAAQLAFEITQDGPITVAQFMQRALFDPELGYYATRPALGAEGDFITAPEASQMFGELLGLWCAHEWTVLGAPTKAHLIELGPGRGALISDLWRAGRVMEDFRAAIDLHLVEPSLPLRRLQAQALANVGAVGQWPDSLADVAAGPTLLIANEVLDCLPIRQFVHSPEGWRERLVGAADGALGFGLSEPLPDTTRAAGVPGGFLREIAVGLEGFLDPIAARLRTAPGRALLLDYGYVTPEGGDTLQALRGHEKVHPLDAPGMGDLTAQVDFAAVAETATGLGLEVAGPLEQGHFLQALGIAQRAAALVQRHPDRQDRIGRELNRLVAPDQMGVLFKAICLSSPGLPPPAGF
jgi:NADH dehydrogenase [ubiquinone] 1 alpha subcomplex assembly factor 7